MKFYKFHWQLDGKCYCCGKSDHKLPACIYKDKSKSEWAINKSKNKQESHLNTESRQELQSADTQSQTSRPASTTTSFNRGWGGVHMQFFQSDNMRDVILLDNKSTVSLFCNHKMVRNIQRVDQELVLHTNARGVSYRHESRYSAVWRGVVPS
jgi:hypothetical protein